MLMAGIFYACIKHLYETSFSCNLFTLPWKPVLFPLESSVVLLRPRAKCFVLTIPQQSGLRGGFYNPGTNPSTFTSQPAGKCGPSLPSHPPAIMATARSKAAALGK